jgi:hypothetical protein
MTLLTPRQNVKVTRDDVHERADKNAVQRVPLLQDRWIPDSTAVYLSNADESGPLTSRATSGMVWMQQFALSHP